MLTMLASWDKLKVSLYCSWSCALNLPTIMKVTFHNIKRHKPVKRVVLALLFFISIDRIYINKIYTVFIILYDRRIFYLEQNPDPTAWHCSFVNNGEKQQSIWRNYFSYCSSEMERESYLFLFLYLRKKVWTSLHSTHNFN